jgi:hypothetical protein
MLFSGQEFGGRYSRVGVLSVSFRWFSDILTAFGAVGCAIATSGAGSAVTHIKLQHFPSAACGVFAGAASLFSAIGFA